MKYWAVGMWCGALDRNIPNARLLTSMQIVMIKTMKIYDFVSVHLKRGKEDIPWPYN